MLLIIGHILAVDGRVKEGREGAGGHQALALVAIGRIQPDGLAHGVVQVEPRRQVVELVDQQHQQVLPPALGRAHHLRGHRRLQKEVEAVDVVLIHALGRGDVTAGHLQHHHGGGALLEHGAADQVGRGIGAVALEFRGDRAVLRALAAALREGREHRRTVGIDKAQEVGIEHHLPIAHIAEIAMQIAAERNQLVLGDRALHRIAVLVKHIALQHQHGAHARKQLQLAMPFGNKGLHDRSPLM